MKCARQRQCLCMHAVYVCVRSVRVSKKKRFLLLVPLAFRFWPDELLSVIVLYSAFIIDWLSLLLLLCRGRRSQPECTFVLAVFLFI